MNDTKKIEKIKHNYYYNKKLNQVGDTAKQIRDREFRARVLENIKINSKKIKLGNMFFMAAFPQFKHYPAVILNRRVG